MISVKVLGWLGKRLRLNSIDLPRVFNTDELLSLLDNLYPKFRFYLKQMSLNNVYYVVYIDHKPYNIRNLLKDAIPLSDGVLIEFIPYFKFNASYYHGMGVSDLTKEILPSIPLGGLPFISKLFSYLESNPLRAEDNEPYREVFKQRQKEYEDFKKSLYNDKNKGDFISESNTIEYGESIPIAYGTVKYHGRTIINNVITSIVPKISSSTLQTLQNRQLITNNVIQNHVSNNQVGGTVSLDKLTQSVQATRLDKQTAMIEEQKKRWRIFESLFNDNDQYQLNHIVDLKDVHQQIIAENTKELSFKSYGFRPAMYHDEGGACFFFFLYHHLVAESEELIKDLKHFVVNNHSEFLSKFARGDKFEKYRRLVIVLNKITEQIKADAVSVYNYADECSGFHAYNLVKRDICRLTVKVFGVKFVKEQMQDEYVKDWTSTQNEYILNKTEMGRDQLLKLHGDYGERGLMIKLINDLKNMVY